MGVLDSVDNVLASINTNGAWRRTIFWHASSGQTGTSPTATAGGPTYLIRDPRVITVPTMGAGITGTYLIKAKVGQISTSGLAGTMMLGIEYKLGSINLATGTFTDGVAMPSKKHSGLAAVQSATQIVGLGVDAVLTATTPT